ncbi:WYL domain-containing protein [Brachybacterium sillae]|uniref:WYL domain-containing protein n=1 Tax=Brachybacterium sillae TaxID=2810536 RepID=UPI00217E231F|nr:WYL domain-containing protein [Brachybacterium sillae]
MSTRESVERLLNVIMTVGSRRRIDRSALFAVIPEYRNATSPGAAERMFERDKAAIIELGIPLVSEVDPFDDTVVQYRIDAELGRRTALDLTPQEYTVALAASRAWDDTAGGTARRLRAKLLGLGQEADPDLARRTPRAALESLPVLSPLLEAVTSGRAVSFSYRTASGRVGERHVEPWIVGVHRGAWYVGGYDRDRDAPRVFRASRLESYPRVTGAAVAERPAQLRLAEMLETDTSGREEQPVLLQIEPYKALGLRRRVGADAQQREVRIPRMRRTDALREVLSAAAWVTLREPETWRTELASVLERIADRHDGAPSADPEQLRRTAPPRERARIRNASSGADRLSRLITEAAYVMRRGEVPVDDMAQEFGITTRELIADLQVLFLCGDLGSGWEDLIEAEWEGGIVRVRNAAPLRQPLRLSAAEATALLAGLAALGPVEPAEQNLVDAVRTKLERSLRASARTTDTDNDTANDTGGAETAADPSTTAPDAASTPLGAASAGGRTGTILTAPVEDAGDPATRFDTALVAALRSAVAEDRSVVVRYSPPDRPGTSVRRVLPREITSKGDRWYLRAHWVAADQERSFRLDRIVEVLDDLPPGESEPEPQSAPDRAPLGPVDLLLDAAGAWIADVFDDPETAELPGGGLHARLVDPVPQALLDAVLEAGGAAEVLAPAGFRDRIVTVARAAAGRHREGSGGTLDAPDPIGPPC